MRYRLPRNSFSRPELMTGFLKRLGRRKRLGQLLVTLRHLLITISLAENPRVATMASSLDHQAALENHTRQTMQDCPVERLTVSNDIRQRQQIAPLHRC